MADDGSDSSEMDVGDFGDFMEECDEALEGVELPVEISISAPVVAREEPIEREATRRPVWEAGKVQKKTAATDMQHSAPKDGGNATVRDADDLLEFEFEALIAAGTHTVEEVQTLKAQKRHREELYVCKHYIQNKMWETDPSCSERDVYLCYAAALEGLNRQNEAIELLQDHDSFQIQLALAKLLFKADRKEESLSFCEKVIAAKDDERVSVEDAVDAYYLAGWVKIHGDDHTGAYKIWSEGHLAIPSDPVLARQHNKRFVWDELCGPLGETDLCGQAAHGDGCFLKEDLNSYKVDPCRMAVTPALSLFDREMQDRNVVFRTRNALLTEDECARVLQHVEDFHAEERNGIWGTVRKSSVPTTDVAVEDIPVLRPWLRELLHTRMFPMLHAAFPLLADGSTVIDPQSGESRMRVHDAFIVRYDAEKDKSLSLPEHCDTSSMSFTLALNSKAAQDFEGGGTWFEALGPEGQVVDADVGQAVAFAGPLRHAGYPITKGTRVILVLFLYVEGFPYGQFIRRYCGQNGCDGQGNVASEDTELKQDESTAPRIEDNGDVVVKASGDNPGGFVVYRQTVELVNMLNKGVVSIVG